MASLCDVLPESGLVQPGMSRSGGVSGEGVWDDLVVGQESDGGAAHGFIDGGVGLLFIVAATDGRDAVPGEGEKFIEESCFAIIAAVVVGNGDQVKPGVEQAIIGARVAAKVVGLWDRRAQSGDDALQVADGEVEAAQKIGGVGKGVGI